MSKKSYLFIALALVLGWSSHLYYNVHLKDRSTEVIQIREDSSENKFINPLILVADQREVEFDEYTELKKKLKDYVEKAKRDDQAEDISLYFRDLDSGEWEGIDEESLYAPSSMLKVSVLLAYLKLVENDPRVLLEKAYYEPKDDSGQTYPASKRLPLGNRTVRELLNQMITQSDNDAMKALDNLHVEEVLQIYNDLQLPDPLQESLDFMSPRAYSRLFRALYNGSYISKAYSEEALNLLSRTNFNHGLTTLLGSTTVSHKFGELTNTLDGKVVERQLHDCGIVYYPENPYFICVMTRGHDFKTMEKVISDISKITFEYFRHKKQ